MNTKQTTTAKVNSRLLALLTALCLLLGIVPVAFSVSADDPEVEPFTLSKTDVSFGKGGNSGWITISGYNADVHGTLTAKSNNEDIATVLLQPNPRLRITGVGVGTTEVVVSSEDGKTSATVTVTVTAPNAQAMALSKTSLLLKSGESDSLSAIVLPSDAANKDVTWSSSDETVATVNENGVVTSVNGGTATITATTTNNIKATCLVNPVEESISENDRRYVQGNNRVLYLYFSAPSYYTATRLSNGDFWNVATERPNTANVNNKITTAIKPMLSALNTVFPQKVSSYEEQAKYLSNKVTLYRDKELTDPIGTYTETNRDIIDFTNTKDLFLYDLEPDTTYYLKFSKDIEVEGVPLGSNIILEFTTKKLIDSVTLDKSELTLEEGNTEKSLQQH